jgi:GDPmannose 4,6-dehydratase
MTVNYREAYGMFAVNGILFNHESPRRGATFLTRKVTRAVARIKAGLQEKVYLGNLNSRRDWGYAPEYVEFMWKMMQQDKPKDYVIGTGKTHQVREFVKAAFDYVGLDWQEHVEVDPRYFRPTEVDHLQADSRRASKELGWECKVTFDDLVKIMVDADFEAVGLEPVGEGLKLLEENFAGWHRWETGVTAVLNSTSNGVD